VRNFRRTSLDLLFSKNHNNLEFIIISPFAQSEPNQTAKTRKNQEKVVIFFCKIMQNKPPTPARLEKKNIS
jgi:hypothetical protein